jgi:hypothetical protein
MVGRSLRGGMAGRLPPPSDIKPGKEDAAMETDARKKSLPFVAAAKSPGEMREQGAPNVDCDALFLTLRRSRRRQKQSADFRLGT